MPPTEQMGGGIVQDTNIHSTCDILGGGWQKKKNRGVKCCVRVISYSFISDHVGSLFKMPAEEQTIKTLQFTPVPEMQQRQAFPCFLFFVDTSNLLHAPVWGSGVVC